MDHEQLDAILTVQLAVAWAGESGDDEPRLRWWDTDMVSKYGGLALMEQLTPRTGAWAVLQVALEAARRVDGRSRTRDASPDQLVSLFHLGLPLDELLGDRLREHKGRGLPPTEVLPAGDRRDRPRRRLPRPDDRHRRGRDDPAHS
ncbi:MAG: BREX-6 system BrxE protein [Myxococcales bacterium]|nr:BREX-6 system BrxE protein [Myxococcales bacterium]